ncbi:MAG: 23S rRNA (pseudouridine(1915)-N(3))-methyltransferase RlmH [Rhodobacteraceae bacterium]|nr:23S rRNA (pseudouridine(1915)-N(3))-methyltransferase RlmH [Paracoccaceae bacterium]
MRVHLCAVGRLKTGPERALIDDYARRFDRTGRSMGLGPLTITEVEDRKGGGMAAESALLTRAVPSGARLCAMDERGAMLGSVEFADKLAGWRDGGCQDLAFVVGGADGLDPSVREAADFSLSLGKMVWPHMLARVMLTEQLYRAASILAGAPYHRV